MNRKKRIETILLNNFNDWTFQVSDNSNLHNGHGNFDGTQESHFCIVIRKPSNSIETRISIHRKINELLRNEFKIGLHALEIKIIN